MAKETDEGYEIVVTSKNEALKVVLPPEVVEKIKDWSEFADKDFENQSNEVILEIILKSLDKLLYGHKHFSLTSNPIENKDGVQLEKKKQEETNNDSIGKN